MHNQPSMHIVAERGLHGVDGLQMMVASTNARRVLSVMRSLHFPKKRHDSLNNGFASNGFELLMPSADAAHSLELPLGHAAAWQVSESGRRIKVAHDLTPR